MRVRTAVATITLVLAGVALLLLAAGDTRVVAGGSGADSITSPDTAGSVGRFTSLQLDAGGNPVVSYYDITNGHLKILRCNDPACSGSDESITSPDTAGNVGSKGTSLQLDAGGNPVVSYYDADNGDLKILHCDDPDCSGGGDSITAPDTGGDVGQFSSLQLDAGGNPVVSYWDATTGDLKILHCDDPNCSGGGESITAPDTSGDVGRYSSLQLDSAGSPVVSYWDATNGDLKILHCDDANCSGGGESITAPATVASVGLYTSLQLDAGGNPVVSYYDDTKDDLKILHCDDANCSGGGDSITAPDTVGNVGPYTSLQLDAGGNPAVSYYDSTNGNLKIMHCNDLNCSGGDESIFAPDTIGIVGSYTSLQLDAGGNPVVSYGDDTNGNLKILHCNDPNCAGGDESITAPDTTGLVGGYTSLQLDAGGNPVVSYHDGTNEDLKILHCNDPNCAGGDGSITAPDVAGSVGLYTSLQLDAGGNPVVSYYDATNGDLKILHCDDPNCSGGGDSITAPDTGGDVGQFSSLQLDAGGNPVVSYYDATNDDLKILHCDDPNCSGGGESMTSPDTGGDVGEHSSLQLDAGGNPVVSYLDRTNGDLKILHCNDPDCAAGDESITAPDTDDRVGFHTSLRLDAGGNPVVSHRDTTNEDLKILHCDDPNCAGGGESITAPDTADNVGQFSSLQLDADGNPVVSYYDGDNRDLRILHCNDPNCTEMTLPPAPAPTATPTPAPSLAPGETPGPTPAPTPTPTPIPVDQLTQGDNDCDGDTDPADALAGLRHVGGLPANQQPGCPALGVALPAAAPAGAPPGFFGDVDCDADVDSVDALKILRDVAAFSVSQTEPCTDIGDSL